MLVARLIDVVVPLFFVGVLMLVVVRFLRGTGRDPEKGGWLHSNAMWKVFGRILFCVGIYFFLTRFFR